MSFFDHPRKRCKGCNRWFDIGTNKDYCPNCRIKKRGKVNGRK